MGAVHFNVFRRFFTFQFAVKTNQHSGLVVIDFQAFFDDFFFIVISLNQIFTGYIVFTLVFRRVVLDVVGAAGRQVYAAATHAGNDYRIRYVDFNHRIQIHTRFHHCFGLSQSAREPVEQETVFAIVLRDALFYHADNDVVAHQAALIDDFLGFQAQRRTGFNGGAQHIASRNLRNIKCRSNKLSLCSFAGTRRS